MNPTRYLTQLSRICQFLFLALLVVACSQEDSRSLTIATGASGGNYEFAGRVIAKIVNQNQEARGFQLHDNLSSGSASNIDAIMAGKNEFGIAQADDQYRALNGLGEWKNKGPQTDLRSVFSLYTESVTLIAGADSGIRTIGDLKGRTVDIGLSGSGTRQNAIDALDAAGIDWKADLEAHEEMLDDRLTMFMHSSLDAFFYTVGHPNADMKFATFSVRGARFIPLVNIEKILSANPFYSRSYIPIQQYPRADNENDVETIGVKAILLTSAGVSEEIVYDITKSVFDNFELLTKYKLVSKTVGKENMLEGLTAPIHSGALRYYQEVGIQVPSSFLGGGSEPVVAIAARDDAVATPDDNPAGSPNTATLTWDAVTDTSLRGYRIYYSSVQGSYLKLPGKGIDVGNVTTYPIKSLTSGKRYYFAVTAVDTSNNESGFSNEVFKDIP